MKRDVTAEYQPVVDKLSKSIGGEAQDWSPKNDSLLRPDFDDRSVEERLADIEAQLIDAREALQGETRADKRIVLVDRVDPPMPAQQFTEYKLFHYLLLTSNV